MEFSLKVLSKYLKTNGRDCSKGLMKSTGTMSFPFRIRLG
jgi:hypothetical protein